MVIKIKRRQKRMGWLVVKDKRYISYDGGFSWVFDMEAVLDLLSAL